MFLSSKHLRNELFFSTIFLYRQQQSYGQILFANFLVKSQIPPCRDDFGESIGDQSVQRVGLLSLSRRGFLADLFNMSETVQQCLIWATAIVMRAPDI
jgi:hypothetical protein